jgi:hypothetical protein
MDLCVHGTIRICEEANMKGLDRRLHSNVVWCRKHGYKPTIIRRPGVYAAIHAPYHQGNQMALHIFNLWVGIDW